MIKDFKVKYNQPGYTFNGKRIAGLINSPSLFDNIGNAYYSEDYINLHIREDNYKCIDNYNTEFWVLQGFIHKQDGPAIIYSDGTSEYFYHGEEVIVENHEEYLKWIRLQSIA